MQLWAKVQWDPLLWEITQTLRQKEEEFDQLEATLITLVPTQRLARLGTSQALKADMDALQQRKQRLSNHLQPWVDEALKLSHDIDVAVK